MTFHQQRIDPIMPSTRNNRHHKKEPVAQLVSIHYKYSLFRLVRRVWRERKPPQNIRARKIRARFAPKNWSKKEQQVRVSLPGIINSIIWQYRLLAFLWMVARCVSTRKNEFIQHDKEHCVRVLLSSFQQRRELLFLGFLFLCREDAVGTR